MPYTIEDIAASVRHDDQRLLAMLLGNILPDEREKLLLSESLRFVVLGAMRSMVQKETIEMLLPFVDAGSNESEFFRAAVAANRFDLVRLFLPLSDPKICEEESLELASMNGSMAIVEFLLPLLDPSVKKNKALCAAAGYGRFDIVKLLLPLSDPKFDNSHALRVAAARNETKLVQLLLPVSDPKKDSSFALQMAVVNQNEELITLLLPLCDPKKALRALKSTESQYKSADLSVLERIVSSQKTKKKLTEKMIDLSVDKPASKLRKF